MNQYGLSQVKWLKYLEREQELFIFASFIYAYGKMFKEVTGFGFRKQLHYYKGTKGIFYREEEEMRECDTYFAHLIDGNDKRINLLIEKEKEIWDNKESFIKVTSVKEQVKLFQEALLYNTVIPYRLLSALTYTKSNHQDLRTRLELIRFRSLYPILFLNLIEPLLEKTRKKLGVSKELVSMVTSQELISILENNLEISEEELKKRNEGCYFFLANDKIVFHYGKFTVVERTINNVNELKGNVACQGMVKGSVKIVNNPKQMEKFQKGDILLSINTNPSLMPVIEKASAIVTDEGGVLCHAAIISRELGIPCITGTEFATKIFNDGDKVEVNAMNGIVKKIMKDDSTCD